MIPKSLRALVFELLHSKSGHLGVHKTLEKVKERFFWPGYEQDIWEAVKKCEACQRRNTPDKISTLVTVERFRNTIPTNDFIG